MSLDLPVHLDPKVTSEADLIRYLQEAEKPRSAHQLGLEHEKFVYPVGSAQPVPYEGPQGIGALLEHLAQRGGELFRETPQRPGIAVTRGQATISLEPGGQLELSGKPAPTARAVHQENLAHLSEAKEVAQGLGLRLVALGHRPFGTTADMPWMPKSRYRVMRETLGKRGSLAFNMMLMTCTGQVSLDWESEDDCARKVTVMSRLAPVVVALYANSPLVNGQPTGLLSFRSHVWTAVDNARCGFFPAMVDGSFSYQAYVRWALDVPLLFLRRNGEYQTPSLRFRQLMERGEATMGDWRDHLSTLFPEVRVKQVIEFRSADSVSAELTGAMAAFFRGITYDATALSEAERLLPGPSMHEHLARMETARKEGLRDAALSQLARDLVGVARAGLQRLDPDDVSVLAPLERVAASGRSPAEDVLELAAKGATPAELLAAFEL